MLEIRFRGGMLAHAGGADGHAGSAARRLLNERRVRRMTCVWEGEYGGSRATWTPLMETFGGELAMISWKRISPFCRI